MRNGIRGLAAAACTVIVLPLLVGCGTPPWEAGSTSSVPARAIASATASASTAPTTSASASPRTRNDLSNGSVKRTLSAGDMTVSVTYWSTRAMEEWTPSADKPLSFSVSAKASSGEEAYLSVAQVDVALESATGATVADHLTPFADRASTSPGYLVTDPQSYSSTIVIPSVSAKATTIDAVVTFSIIEQGSSAGSVKQTATDRLVVALH